MQRIKSGCTPLRVYSSFEQYGEIYKNSDKILLLTVQTWAYFESTDMGLFFRVDMWVYFWEYRCGAILRALMWVYFFRVDTCVYFSELRYGPILRAFNVGLFSEWVCFQSRNVGLFWEHRCGLFFQSRYMGLLLSVLVWAYFESINVGLFSEKSCGSIFEDTKKSARWGGNVPTSLNETFFSSAFIIL